MEIQASAVRCLGVVAGDPAQEFDQVVNPFLLPDGRLVVPLAGPNEIRVFDGGGRFVETLGREGEGPGEFVSLSSAWARGDTIEAFDAAAGRITRFLPGGDTELVTLDRIPSAQSAVPAAASFGWVLSGVAGIELGGRDDVVLHRFGRDGAHLGEMGRLEGMARHQTEHGTGPDPLSPKTVVAMSGDRIYAGETLTPALEVFGADGSPLDTVRWLPDTTVSADVARQAVIAAAVKGVGPDREAETRLRLEAFPLADDVSSFWAVLVDAHGFVWVRPFDPLQHALELGGYNRPGVGGSWRVFSPEGVELPSVQIPAQFEPATIGADAVVGIRRDELGVESVCVHPLLRSGA